MNNIFTPLFAFTPSVTQLVIVLVILLLLFGGAKLPSLARGLGQSIREFKKATADDADDEEGESADGKKSD